MKIFLLILLFPYLASARSIDTDQIQSSDHTKTWTMPAASGVLVVSGSYEPTITPGTTSQYWRGDKTWQNLMADVLGTVLSGLSTATSSSVLSSDTVLAGVGKLQAEVNSSAASITANTASIATKEPSIATSSATNVWHGDKSWSQILNADISNTAAISYSKLNLTGLLVDTDISSSASISLSKLAPLNGYVVGAPSAIVATDTVLGAFQKVQGQLNTNSAAITGKQASLGFGSNGQYLRYDQTWSNILGSEITLGTISYGRLSLAGSLLGTDLALGTVSYGRLSLSNSLVNSDISSSAAIARSKIATGGISKLIVNDGSGNLSEAVSSGWVKLVSGVPNMFASISLLSEVSGVLPISYGGTNAITAASAINNLLPTQTAQTGKYLTTDGANVSWGTVAGGGGSTLAASYKMLAGNQTIATASYTTINFDTAETGVTTSGGTVTTGAAWRYVANATEVLNVCVMTRWQGNSNNTNYAATVSKNNAIFRYLYDTVLPAAGSFSYSPYSCAIVPVVNGDIIQVWGYQSSGGNLNILATESYIDIYKVQ